MGRRRRTWRIFLSSPALLTLTQHLVPPTMNKMKNFKRRFSLSVPRTETIEESLAEFTEQFNQLHNRRNEGERRGLRQPLPVHTSPAGLGGAAGGRYTLLPSPGWGAGAEGQGGS